MYILALLMIKFNPIAANIIMFHAYFMTICGILGYFITCDNGE